VSRRKVVEIQLADCLDVSPEAIYDVVTAKNPSLCNIKICKSQLARIFQLVVDTHTQLKPRTFDPDLLRMSTTLKLERRLEEAEAEAEEEGEAEEAPAEGAPAEEAPAEGAPAEEAPAEGAPAEEAPAEEEGEAEEAPAEGAPAEEAPAEAEAEGESLHDPKFDVPLDDSDREMLLKLETMHKDGDADDHVDWLDEIQDDDGDLDAERDLVADLDDGLDNLDDDLDDLDDLYDDDTEQDLWVPGGDHNTRHVLPHIPNLKGPKPDVFFSPRIADPTSHPHKGRQRYETRDSHEDLLASGILAKGVFASMLVDIDQE
jgi:hypothetical protein